MGRGDFDGEDPGLGIEADELSRFHPGLESLAGYQALQGVQEQLPSLQSGPPADGEAGGQAEGGIEIGGGIISKSSRSVSGSGHALQNSALATGG